MKFTDLNLNVKIQKALNEMGYTELTPIQEQTFKHVLAGRDIIATAETGSGKTAACAIPMLQAADPAVRSVQGLIIVPTRELALQYVAEIAAIAKYTGIEPFAVYGGFSIHIQTGKFEHGVHILVATPGRLIDLLYNTPLSLSNVRTFVLDEADEMLDLGFLADVELILSCMIHKHQTLLFSATMPKEIQILARKYLNDPVTIELNIDQISPESLEHLFQLVRPQHRLETMLEYIEDQKCSQAIMFCNSRRGAEKLYQRLRETLDSIEIIHGGLDQSRRTSLFRRFREMKIRFLVATDVASRGLDFSHTTHVFNYDFPRDPQAYTHRTGRTARMGRKGKAITYLIQSEVSLLRLILRKNNIRPLWLGPEPDLNARPTGHKHNAGRGRRFRR